MISRKLNFTASLLFIVLISSVISVACTSKKAIVEQSTIVDSETYLIAGKNFSQLQVDNIGNIFMVKNNRVLHKYDSDGKLINTYDIESGGFIHSVDALNPLYILIYYRDAGRVVLLDRNLALLNEITISDWSQNDLTAVCLSNDNNLWIYDNTERKLKKYSRNGQLITESMDLYGMTSLNTTVNHMVEHSNSVFLRNEENTLIVMDNLGQYKSDKSISVGFPMAKRRGQLCGPIHTNYSCIRLDDNPFQQVIPVEKLHNDHQESFLFKFELYQILPSGLIKSALITKR